MGRAHMRTEPPAGRLCTPECMQGVARRLLPPSLISSFHLSCRGRSALRARFSNVYITAAVMAAENKGARQLRMRLLSVVLPFR